MQKILMLAVALAIAPPTAMAQEVEPQIFSHGAWLCVSPEAYDAAKAREAEESFESLRADLLAQRQCMYVDEGDIEEIMAPWVDVEERQGDKVKVAFWVEYYEKIAELHRRTDRVRYGGWTAQSNLENYYPE